MKSIIFLLVALLAISTSESQLVTFSSTTDKGTPIDACAVFTSTTVADPEWQKDFVYPIEVCAEFAGKVNSCGAKSAKLSLTIKNNQTIVTTLQKDFTIEPTNGVKFYCNLWDVCEITKRLTDANYAGELSTIRLEGKAEAAVQKTADSTVTDNNLKVLMRETAVRAEAGATQTYEAKQSANYAIVRSGTHCPNNSCITKVEKATATLVKKETKMMLREKAKFPICTDTAEGTKVHVTEFQKKDPCVSTSGNQDCKGSVVVGEEHKSPDGGNTVVASSLMGLLVLTSFFFMI